MPHVKIATDFLQVGLPWGRSDITITSSKTIV